jgi:hypothetical protein
MLHVRQTVSSANLSITRTPCDILLHSVRPNSPAVLGNQRRPAARFAYGTLTRSGHGFHRVRLACRSGRRGNGPPSRRWPHNPVPCPAGPPYMARAVWARSPFARRYLGPRCYFWAAGTEMFQFPRRLRRRLRRRSPRVPRSGSPIRSPRDRRLLAPPPSLAWRATTFFALSAPRHPPCAFVIFLL